MDEERPDAHLRDVADGCGCTEIWEHTSDARAAGDDGEVRAVEADGDARAAEADGEARVAEAGSESRAADDN